MGEYVKWRKKNVSFHLYSVICLHSWVKIWQTVVTVKTIALINYHSLMINLGTISNYNKIFLSFHKKFTQKCNLSFKIFSKKYLHWRKEVNNPTWKTNNVPIKSPYLYFWKYFCVINYHILTICFHLMDKSENFYIKESYFVRNVKNKNYYMPIMQSTIS